MQKKKIIVIAGPTASGKSQLAIDAALAVNGVVVNADSMQVYKDMPVISACPTPADKALVSHRLYEIWDASKNGSVVEWLSLAAGEIEKICQEGKIPIVVGGTGLYLDNLINGTTPVPETKPEIRKKVEQLLEKNGVNALYEKLKQTDPETAIRLSPNDKTRIRRAWEVFLDTGKKLSEWHKLPMVKKFSDAVFFVVKLIPEKEELDERCARRFDRMMASGAREEAENLFRRGLKKTLPAMRALGVPELISQIEGEISPDEAVRLGKLHTRQYAKRQKTWFKHKLKADFELNQCYNGQKEVVEKIIKFVKS